MTTKKQTKTLEKSDDSEISNSEIFHAAHEFNGALLNFARVATEDAAVLLAKAVTKLVKSIG